MTSLFSPKIQAALDYRLSVGQTIENHAFYLRSFDGFCATNYPNESVLTKDIAWEWAYSPLHKSQNAVHHRIKAIRFFGTYLAAIGEDAYVFPSAMTNTQYSLSPHIFTDDELRRFFAAADNYSVNTKDPLQHRIAPVVFRLIYTCGLRPNEGRELKRANINLDTGEILITNTKFQKERLIAMSDDMLALCRDYARCLDKGPSLNSEYFFPARNGGCYHRNQFSKLFGQCWRQANADVSAADLPRVRVYDLRHRFASAILNRWIDEKRDLYTMLPYLRAYMGHAAMSATEYYVHLLPENLVKSQGINWSALEGVIPEVDE